MTTVHVGDVVALSNCPGITGDALPTTSATGGLHPTHDLDTLNTGAGTGFNNSGLAAVRWNTAPTAYEWWEDPDLSTVVRPAPPGAPSAVH